MQGAKGKIGRKRHGEVTGGGGQEAKGVEKRGKEGRGSHVYYFP